MAIKTALRVTAQVLSVECPCGGFVHDTRNGSGMITSDTTDMACESCGATIRIRANAKIGMFV